MEGYSALLRPLTVHFHHLADVYSAREWYATVSGDPRPSRRLIASGDHTKVADSLAGGLVWCYPGRHTLLFVRDLLFAASTDPLASLTEPGTTDVPQLESLSVADDWRAALDEDVLLERAALPTVQLRPVAVEVHPLGDLSYDELYAELTSLAGPHPHRRFALPARNRLRFRSDLSGGWHDSSLDTSVVVWGGKMLLMSTEGAELLLDRVPPSSSPDPTPQGDRL